MYRELSDHGTLKLIVLQCRDIGHLTLGLDFLGSVLSLFGLEVCEDQLLIGHRSCVGTN